MVTNRKTPGVYIVELTSNVKSKIINIDNKVKFGFIVLCIAAYYIYLTIKK